MTEFFTVDRTSPPGAWAKEIEIRRLQGTLRPVDVPPPQKEEKPEDARDG